MRKLNKFFAIAILMTVTSLSAPHAFGGIMIGDAATPAPIQDGYTLGSIVGPIYQIAGYILSS